MAEGGREEHEHVFEHSPRVETGGEFLGESGFSVNEIPFEPNLGGGNIVGGNNFAFQIASPGFVGELQC